MQQSFGISNMKILTTEVSFQGGRKYVISLQKSGAVDIFGSTILFSVCGPVLPQLNILHSCHPTPQTPPIPKAPSNHCDNQMMATNAP